ncbi:MAG: leucine-rich repeat domain-containing protein [Rikenellaceae bacterium]
MRKLFIIATALCASMMLYSCEESQTTDEVEKPDVEKPQDSDDGYYLADVDEENIPDEDVWVILDESATAEDFEGVAAAIATLSESGDREIELEFPSLKTLPAIIVGTDSTKAESDRNYGALVSVSALDATEIEAWAFAYCNGLRTVSLLAATTIGEGAFCGCEALTTVELATNVDALLSSIGNDVFGEVSENIDLTSSSVNYDFVVANTLTVGTYSADFKNISLVDEDGNIVDKNYTVTYALVNITAENIPEEDLWIITDTTAESTDFAGFSAAIEALAESGREISVEFPNLEAIPTYAIFGKEEYNSDFESKALVSVSAPKATSIEKSAFLYCYALTSVELPKATSIGESAFYSCTALTSVELPKATSIVEYAFYGCTALASVELPLVTSIGRLAFSKCESLTSIELPEATSIGNNAFYYCSGLTSVELPVATSIELNAFYSCTALTSVELPKATSIGESTFSNCESLTSIELPEATLIGNYAFYSCTALTSVELPAATSIGKSAFYSCTALTSMELPAATSIGAQVFWKCLTLTDISLATNDGVVLSSIDSDAFYDVTTTDVNLTIGEANSGFVSGNTLTIGDFSAEFKSITLVDGNGEVIESYGALADYSAESYPLDTDTWVIKDEIASTDDFVGLRDALIAIYHDDREIELVFPNLTTFPDKCFSDLDSGCRFSVEADVATSVGDNAFDSCTTLTSIDLPAATYIGWQAFYDCLALTSVSLPAATEIWLYAFLGCDALTSIDLPVATLIAAYSFVGCDALTSVNLSVAPAIGSYAFSVCDTLTTVNLPATTEICEYAFDKCPALTEISLATNDGVVLSSIDSNAFGNVTTTNVKLTIGEANSGFVSGNTLTVGDFRATFKSITLK